MLLRRSEAEIMEALWNKGEPMSSSALIEAVPERRWKERSIFAIVDGLLRKELIYEAGFVRRGKTIARTFAPTMDYPTFIARQVAESSYHPALPELFSAFLSSEEVTEETMKELETLIKQKRAELKK